MALPSVSMAGRRKAFCLIYINGVNVTDKMNPYLISVTTTDRKWPAKDECHIELDDTDGVLPIPGDNTAIRIHMGWEGQGPRLPIFRRPSSDFDLMPSTDQLRVTQPADFTSVGGPQSVAEMPWEEGGMRRVFQGMLESIESGFSRRAGGRRLWVEATSEAKGGDKDHQKSIMQQSFGSGAGMGEAGGGLGGGDAGEPGGVKLGDILQKVGGMMGIDLKVSPEIANLTRNFIYMNESPQHFLQRLMREVGGNVSMSGNQGFITANDGRNANGDKLATVEAVWGVNLLSWRIKPFITRPQYGSAHRRFYDTAAGRWKGIKSAIEGGSPFGAAQAIIGSSQAAASSGAASQGNKGAAEASKSKRGNGYVVIVGEPMAYAGGSMIVSGARPGIDGTYVIEEREHSFSRAGGFITRCTLARPEFAAAQFDAVRAQPVTPLPKDSFTTEENPGPDIQE